MAKTSFMCFKTAEEMTKLAAEIVNASEVVRLGQAIMNTDPYHQPLPERIRRQWEHVEEKKTSSKTSTDRT